MTKAGDKKKHLIWDSPFRRVSAHDHPEGELGGRQVGVALEQ